jgi:hypothetical protein
MPDNVDALRYIEGFPLAADGDLLVCPFDEAG